MPGSLMVSIYTDDACPIVQPRSLLPLKSKAYKWNLEKWYQWTYLQGRNRGTDLEKGLVDTTGGEGGWIERVALT